MYTCFYNMVMVVLANLDMRKAPDKIVALINSILEQISEGPFSSHHNKLYLLEQGCEMDQ